ncbi:flagellar protein FliO/FliZ [Lentibacillus halodurans]|uniref:Flagellar protein FliO/FliZ n=1 Tax=Lentibacillus halodurans TaxID=237679 RepID=A0A1I0VMA5_9BACI|nr:flagellar biosynthetic protein FliO [Lentibacillus halodurans]SFA77431.1 flagellar protein FliO/FliZ [Lentibacillus halodurans]
MKLKIMAIIGLIGLWCVIYPNGAAEASMNVKNCIENKDCTETDEAPADTADNQQSETTGSVESGSLWMNLVKMVLALLLVLGLIYTLLKFLNKRSRRFQQIKGLENIGGISVGPNKSVQVVRIGSKVFLVGVGENVELLKEIIDEDTKRALLHRDDAGEHKSAGGLTSFLQQTMTGKSDYDHSNDFKKQFASELEKLKQTRNSLLKSKQKDDHYE